MSAYVSCVRLLDTKQALADLVDKVLTVIVGQLLGLDDSVPTH